MSHIHYMDFTFNSANKFELLCPNCGKKIIFEDDRIDVIVEGDVFALHRASSGGLQITEAELPQDEQLEEVWKNAIEKLKWQ